jgi:hypothetical protein
MIWLILSVCVFKIEYSEAKISDDLVLAEK